MQYEGRWLTTLPMRLQAFDKVVPRGSVTQDKRFMRPCPAGLALRERFETCFPLALVGIRSCSAVIVVNSLFHARHWFRHWFTQALVHRHAIQCRIRREAGHGRRHTSAAVTQRRRIIVGIASKIRRNWLYLHADRARAFSCSFCSFCCSWDAFDRPSTGGIALTSYGL